MASKSLPRRRLRPSQAKHVSLIGKAIFAVFQRDAKARSGS